MTLLKWTAILILWAGVFVFGFAVTVWAGDSLELKQESAHVYTLDYFNSTDSVYQETEMTEGDLTIGIRVIVNGWDGDQIPVFGEPRERIIVTVPEGWYAEPNNVYVNDGDGVQIIIFRDGVIG